jgi:hypothetical protein
MKLPRGKNLKPDKIENFFEICRQLDSEFTGALRLRGIVDRRVYTADLLVDVGTIIAASFNFVGSNETLLRDAALDFIKNNLSGSSGKLDIFEFDSGEMRRSIESNPSALLEEEVKVHDLGVKIKSTIVRKAPGAGLFEKIAGFIKKPSSERKTERVNEIKSLRDGFRRQEEWGELDFGRQSIGGGEAEEMRGMGVPQAEAPYPSAPSVKASEAEGAPSIEEETGVKTPPAAGVEAARKEERLQKIKESRLKKISERITLEGEARNVKKIVEGMKVKTTIDKLYELVLDKGAVKINDELAQKLGVSKTQIEEWAMVLEEHNLAELHYPAIGEPEIKKMHEKTG